MAKYKVNDDYMLREIAGEAVLVPIGENTQIQNAMINLNETCAYLWKAFAEPRTIESVIEETVKEFEGDREIIARDITGFVMQGLPLGVIIQTEE